MSRLNPLRVEKTVASQLDQRRICNAKPVLESHLDLLRESAFSDVTFIVGPSKEMISCHQLFLKARSPVFQAMFTEQWTGNSKEIPLEDVDPKIFRKFLEFIYADTFDVDVSEALEMLQVAHKYDVQLLVTRCEKFLENEVTLDHVLQVARKHEKFERMSKVDLLANIFANLESDVDTRKSLASSPKFSNPRRATDDQVHPLPPGSISLYSGSFSNYAIRRQTYNGLLYESVNVSIHVVDDAFGLPMKPSALVSPGSEKKSVAVSGISFYCPKATNVNTRITAKTTREFDVSLDEGTSCDEDYEQMRYMSEISVEEGTIMELEFDRAVRLHNRKWFQFTVAEVSNRECTCEVGDRDYEARDFGNIQPRVTTTLGDKFVLVGCSRVGNAEELSDKYSQPQLIYKISLIELPFTHSAPCKQT